MHVGTSMEVLGLSAACSRKCHTAGRGEPQAVCTCAVIIMLAARHMTADGKQLRHMILLVRSRYQYTTLLHFLVTKQYQHPYDDAQASVSNKYQWKSWDGWVVDGT